MSKYFARREIVSEEISTLMSIYHGWQNYQGLLIAALVPLDQAQLSLRSAAHLHSIEEIATHMIGERSRLFGSPIADGDLGLKEFRRWDLAGEPERSSLQIQEGLRYTLDYIHQCVKNWTPEEWSSTWPGDGPSEPAEIQRQWIVWHLLEHDLHHGGEISLTMMMYHLKAPAL
jgi:uncharacterized damage-inducible protein DinB